MDKQEKIYFQALLVIQFSFIIVNLVNIFYEIRCLEIHISLYKYSPNISCVTTCQTGIQQIFSEIKIKSVIEFIFKVIVERLMN